MNHYANFNIEDFVADEKFVRWCLGNDASMESFWQDFINEYPHQKFAVYEAKELVLDLYEIQKEETFHSFSQDIWSNIDKKINENNSKYQDQKFKTNTFIRSFLKVAAIFVFSLSVLFGLKMFMNQTNKNAQGIVWINTYNNTNIAKTIVLDDNSKVVLEPYSMLKYPKHFQGDQRAVFLKGEAFFDIKRDTLKPFLVYANETITKVLGTSFKVFAYEGQQSVKVDVISGKVAVYANVKDDKKSQKAKKLVLNADEQIIIPQPNKKLEITPNQSVVFDITEANMVKTVMELPRILVDANSGYQFQYNEESVAKVFEALEYTYGIPFKFDKKELSNCTITTKLDDEPLLQKVAIICSALNLQYREEDATIIVEGRGCN